MERPIVSPARRKRDHSAVGQSVASTDLSEIRLNRYIARAGVCSRRKADDLILEGVVRVNGEIVTKLGTRVRPGDDVSVNGRRISPSPFEYILLNKPTNTITTTEDEKGRRTVLDLMKVPAGNPAGLFPVGRLDRDTTGALLITNDGELAHRLMHPRYEIEKMYRVSTERPVTKADLAQMATGIRLEDGIAAADNVDYIDVTDHRIIGISIHEGRNRQVRRMLESLGHSVRRLDRVVYAGLTLEGIRRGKWRKLRRDEISRLYRRVRLKTK